MTHRARAIVTGGAGFIGSHLCEEFVARGCETIALDDLSSGKIENISKLIDSGSVRFVRGSIADFALLSGLFEGADYVLHQAAVASVARSIEEPLGCNETNVAGTLNVLLAARDNGVKKVIFASSAAVYGRGSGVAASEEMAPAPQSPYAVTKLTGEYYCRVFQEVFGVPTVSLRYFNVYGPRQDPKSEYSGVIAKFIQRAMGKEPVTIFGDGSQTRDFVFVGDVVRANMLAVETDATGVFNIGSGKSTTINELARLVAQLTGSDIKSLYRQARPGDIKYSLADISKARAAGYQPRYSLEEGLKLLLSALGYR